jgi:hypothetical protein
MKKALQEAEMAFDKGDLLGPLLSLTMLLSREVII